MKDLIPVVINDLIMIFSFVLILMLARTADICLGAVLAYKDITLTFDYKKLIKGVIYSLICGVALILLTTAITLLPELFNIFNISFIDNENFKEITNLSIVAIIATSSIKRMNDCKNKFQKIAHVNNEEIVELQITDGRD